MRARVRTFVASCTIFAAGCNAIVGIEEPVRRAPDACTFSSATITDGTPSGGCGVTCNASYAEIEDDKGAGLDCDGFTYVVIDDEGHTVSSCVRADFGPGNGATEVTVRARVVNEACAKGCLNEGCTQGGIFRVFSSNEPPTYVFAADVQLDGEAWANKTVTLAAAARYVLVCRSGLDSYVRDVEIDVIRSAVCP
jgi:hypothetical protein